MTFDGVPDNVVAQKIEAAIALRKEVFTLSHLARTGRGYTVKFRQGIADIVRTEVDAGTFEDSTRLDKLLDEVRTSFLKLRP
jgi:hypothetical protein